PATAAPAVDGAAAERAGLAAAGGGRVTASEFESDDRDDRDDDGSDDRDHWEVEVRNGTTEHDIDIDAATGAVLDHDVDHHDRDRLDSDDHDDHHDDDRDDDRDDD
ncbi:PepSY domain-containing protein, partial [Pseudonocardia tropica]|uniref:PepSY domain-containing protein n=1 Tax=Pseudonocardia tropica TaxID=681289 RepID=UPI0031E4EB88